MNIYNAEGTSGVEEPSLICQSQSIEHKVSIHRYSVIVIY